MLPYKYQQIALEYGGERKISMSCQSYYFQEFIRGGRICVIAVLMGQFYYTTVKYVGLVIAHPGKHGNYFVINFHLLISLVDQLVVVTLKTQMQNSQNIHKDSQHTRKKKIVYMEQNIRRNLRNYLVHIKSPIYRSIELCSPFLIITHHTFFFVFPLGQSIFIISELLDQRSFCISHKQCWELLPQISQVLRSSELAPFSQ